MFYGVTFLSIGFFIFLNSIFLRKVFFNQQRELEAIYAETEMLEQQEKKRKDVLVGLEAALSRYFSFYEITKKIAPFLTEKELFSHFCEEIRYFNVQEVSIEDKAALAQESSVRNQYQISEDKYLFVKISSQEEEKYISHFQRLLRLCVERISLYSKLQSLSIYDGLTQLSNRRMFMKRFYEEFERAKKHNLSFSFLMIDVDHFKLINDTHGHLVGDVVLKEVAKRMRGNMRDIDFIARFGGEEFAVILPDTVKKGALLVGERLLSCIENLKISAFDEKIQVTISVGISVYPQDALYADKMIESADSALYKAKVTGRNRVCCI